MTGTVIEFSGKVRDVLSAMRESAGAKIEALQAESARYRAALEPFAAYVKGAPASIPDSFVMTQGSSIARRQLTMGDCRAAKTALETV